MVVYHVFLVSSMIVVILFGAVRGKDERDTVYQLSSEADPQFLHPNFVSSH
jgi:hypothetical protein